MARGEVGFREAARVGSREFAVRQLAVEHCAIPLGCTCRRENMQESQRVPSAVQRPAVPSQ